MDETGSLAYVATGTPLSAEDIKGKVVVRDAVPGSLPYAAFRAVSWFEWDPTGSMLGDIAGTYERDFAGYNQRLTAHPQLMTAIVPLRDGVAISVKI